MTEDDWFDSDGFELDEVQAAFLALLRARASGWPAHPTDTMLFPGAFTGRPYRSGRSCELAGVQAQTQGQKS